MTTPDVPLRLELTFELPGTPEQVWAAIATANGISSWFMPTELEERQGGSLVLHMGPEEMPATITGWDPPRRFAYEEPDWARYTGHEGVEVTPLATEFLIEARSGGTCVLRVVTSAFGSGADWEQEFFDEMHKGWTPFFENLRLYLTHFSGQRVTSLSAFADVAGSADAVWSALRQALGAGEVGQAVEGVRGIRGQLERVHAAPDPNELLVRLSEPVPGFLGFGAWDKGDGTTGVVVVGYLFSDDAPGYVEREQEGWRTWLAGLAVPTG
jgi:uncharacterized protein YndB with AHSA1/START domain